MNLVSNSLRLRRSSLFAAMLIGVCSRSAFVGAAGPVPVPIPPPAAGIVIANPGAIAKAQGIQHQFQLGLSCPGSSTGSCESSFALPENRRLVLEYVSGRCIVPGNSVLISMDVSTSVQPEGPTLHALNHVDHPLSHLAIAAHPVKIYADAGSTVILRAAINLEQQTWSCEFSLSGQSVDVP